MSSRLTWRESLFRSAFPLVMSDIAAVFASYYLALMFRVYSEWGHRFFAAINAFFEFRGVANLGPAMESFYVFNAPRILLILCVTLLGLYVFLDLYAVRRFIRRRYEGLNVSVANLAALSAFFMYFYLSRNQFHPRSMFGTVLVLNTILCLSFRGLTRALLRESGLARCPALLIGGSTEAETLGAYIGSREPQGLIVAARMERTASEPMAAFLKRVRDLVSQHGTRMILCADPRLTVAEIMQVLEVSGELDQETKVLSERLNVLVTEAAIPADFFFEMPLVHFAVPPRSRAWRLWRRVGDLVLATAGVVLTFPLMLLIAVLIRATSAGPVFFVQERIGINRRPFMMYKFRTMFNRADELLAQVEEFNEAGGGLFKMRHDPRVTPVGRVLRRFSIDELPQLINVLRGDMAIVGPRPLPRRDFANYYEDWHYGRHSGLPGLTCLWQVSGRSDMSFHNMCILDDYYLRNQGVILDLKIILRTMGVVLFAKGAY